MGAAFLSSTGSSSQQLFSTSSAQSNSVFDNDMRFQKFLIFIVDFIHVIYDKISDNANKESSYDINDELSLFSFSILMQCLSIGFETNTKTKFSSLFKSNLNFIKIQVRDLFFLFLV